MDRQRRTASKVTVYRKFHLSGDLDQVVLGKVSSAVELLETPCKDKVGTMSMMAEDATPAQLEEMLREQKESGNKLQQQVEAMKLRNQLEVEKLQQQQWELAIDQLKKSREHMTQQHLENMEKIRAISQEAEEQHTSQAVAWLQDELTKASSQAPLNVSSQEQQEEAKRQARFKELQRQQEEINREMDDIMGPQQRHPSLNTLGGGKALPNPAKSY